MRLGINSGEVVVGRIGHSSSARVVAIGHAAGIAKRIESLARPGAVYLSEHTAELVEDAFHLRVIGSVDIRGVHAPVAVFELLAQCSLEKSGTSVSLPEMVAA